MADTSTWDTTKQRVLTRWPALTEDDVAPTEGRREALVALLEDRLGYARANAEHDVDQLLEGDRVVPRDVADEFNHTGTASAQGGSFASAAPANADRGTDQRFERDRSVPRDPGGYAGTTAAPGGPFASTSQNANSSSGQYSNPYANGGSFGAGAFGASSHESASWDGNTMREATFNEAINNEMAWPWRTPAAIAAAVGALGVTTMALRARRKSQRKHLVIPLPTQAESAQAVEAVGHAAGSGWKYLRSLTVLLVGGIAGWGVRRYQAM